MRIVKSPSKRASRRQQNEAEIGGALFRYIETSALLAAVPTLLVYMFLGRYFLRGLLAGSLKG